MRFPDVAGIVNPELPRSPDGTRKFLRAFSALDRRRELIRCRGMIKFASYRLDPGAGRLWRSNQPVALRPKAWALLRYLAARPSRCRGPLPRRSAAVDGRRSERRTRGTAGGAGAGRAERPALHARPRHDVRRHHPRPRRGLGGGGKARRLCREPVRLLAPRYFSPGFSPPTCSRTTRASTPPRSVSSSVLASTRPKISRRGAISAVQPVW